MAGSSWGRVVAVVRTTALVVALGLGCAGPARATGTPTPSPRAVLSPGPPVPAGAQVRVDELVITDGGDRDSLRTEVTAPGGRLASSDERIGVLVARFSRLPRGAARGA